MPQFSHLKSGDNDSGCLKGCGAVLVSCSCSALSLANRSTGQVIMEVATNHVHYLLQSHPESENLWLLLRRVVCGWRFQHVTLSGVKEGWAWRQEPWLLVQAPFSVSVFGRVPLALRSRVGKLPAPQLSLGEAQVGRGDKKDQGLQGGRRQRNAQADGGVGETRPSMSQLGWGDKKGGCSQGVGFALSGSGVEKDSEAKPGLRWAG